MTRPEGAAAWFAQEYEPGGAARRGTAGRGTEAEAYVRVVALSYLLLRTHDWDDEIERLRRELERPSTHQDTMVRRLRRGLSR